MALTTRIALVCLSVLALSGCGRKPARVPTNQAPASSAASETAAAPAKTTSLFSADCPVAPLKSAVQDALKSAMVQIYGTDEAPVRFVVSDMAPAADCKNMVVHYLASGTKSVAPLAYDDDGKWYVTLYAKHYAVR